MDWNHVDGFDWDAGNLHKSRRKHGMDAHAVEDLFRRSPAVRSDPQHSAAEARWIAVGPGPSGRWMLVVFTLRRAHGRTLIRPISARYMHQKEIRRYADDPAPPKEG